MMEELDLVGKCFIGMILRKVSSGWFELHLVMEWREGTCIPKISLRVEASLQSLNSYLSKVAENLFKVICVASHTPSNLLVLRFTKGGILSLPLNDIELFKE